WWTQEALLNDRVPHVVADEIITFEEGTVLDQTVYQLVWNWSRLADRDFSEWHGIPLGRLYFVELLTGCFVPYAKMIRAATKFMATHQPNGIWTDFPSESMQARVLELCCRTTEIPLERVEG